MSILIAAKQLRRTNGGVCTHILDLCKGYTQGGHKIVLIADGTDYQSQINSIKTCRIRSCRLKRYNQIRKSCSHVLER